MPKEPEHKKNKVDKKTDKSDSSRSPKVDKINSQQSEIDNPSRSQRSEVSKETKDFSKLLKEREQDEKIDKSIKEIYDNEPSLIKVRKDGKENKEKTIERKQKNPGKQLVLMFLILLLVVAGISWVLFFIFNSGTRMNKSDIEFEFTGLEEVVAGEEIIYEIKYKNLSEFDLKDIRVDIIYPENFIFIDSVPEVSESNHTWKIENIDASRSGRIQIKGKIIDKIDAQELFLATMRYRPENFSSTFSNDAELTTKITTIGLSAMIEFPSIFNVDNDSEIKINYTKEKESFFDNFRVLIEHGEEFILEDKDSGGVWDIDTLTEKQESFLIKGKYNKKPSAEEKIIIKLANQIEGKNKEGELEQKYYTFYEEEFVPQVAEGALNLTLSVNGSVSNKSIDIDDSLKYVVHYKNNSDATLNNIIIMAVINSEAVSWKNVSDSNQGEINDNTIIWTKEEISDLASIAPDEEDSFSFSIQLKSEEQIKKLADAKRQIVTSLDYSINSAVKADGNYATQIINKINSDLKFNSELRYFDRNGSAVGDGPLPPKVGEKTSYRVYWSLSNSWHDLESIEASTILPNYIRWENSQTSSVGNVVYNTDSRKVSWKIDELDTAGEPAMLEFTISLTPAEADKNKILTVLNSSQTQAKDKSTSGIITTSSKAKTTNLDDDEVGKGYGKVE